MAVFTRKLQQATSKGRPSPAQRSPGRAKLDSGPRYSDPNPANLLCRNIIVIAREKNPFPLGRKHPSRNLRPRRPSTYKSHSPVLIRLQIRPTKPPHLILADLIQPISLLLYSRLRIYPEHVARQHFPAEEDKNVVFHCGEGVGIRRVCSRFCKGRRWFAKIVWI